MHSRIDVIGSNGNDGEAYLVEQVCRLIAGHRADRVEFDKGEKKKGWQAHQRQAMEIIEVVRKFDKGE